MTTKTSGLLSSQIRLQESAVQATTKSMAGIRKTTIQRSKLSEQYINLLFLKSSSLFLPGVQSLLSVDFVVHHTI